MRFLKLSMAFPMVFGMLLFLAVGCQKETNDAPVFVEKTFFPTGEQDAKTRVTSFLEAVKASKSGERTAFPDTEVNEGRWTLAGSVNYEKNPNLVNEGVNSIEIYTLNVDNIVVNNTIKMSGTDMTSKYAGFLSTINSEEVASGRTATIADLKIVSVTNSTTELEAKVIFTVPSIPNISGGITWEDAAEFIGGSLPNWFTISGCVPFTPDPTFVGFPPNTFATSRTSMEALGATDYQFPWLPFDIADANGRLTQFIANNQNLFNQNTPPGQATAGGAWHYVGGALVRAEMPNNVKQHHFGSMTIAQVSFCF